MKKIIKLVISLILIISIICVISNLKNIKNEILKKVYKIEYSEIVEQYSKEYNVDKYLIYAIIKAESNFDEKANSSKGAKGLMQLMYSTAEELAKKNNIEINQDNVYNPDINIKLGTYYISILIQKYQNIALALAGYNAGSGCVDNWLSNGIIEKDASNIENIPYNETNNYVRKILRDYEIYKDLYKT